MYAEFLRVLAEIAEKLDEAAKMGSDEGIGTPYIAGSLEVRLQGERVGEFRIEDEFVLYYADSPPRNP